MATTDDVLALYDAHAPRLFALALRIVSDRAAASAVLEQVFATTPMPREFPELVRLTRELALARQIQTGRPAVSPPTGDPSPRLVLEEAFFHRRSVSELARQFSVDEATIVRMIRDGMNELTKR